MWPLRSCSPDPGGLPPLEPKSLGEAKGPTAKRPIPLVEGQALARGIFEFKSPAVFYGRGVQKRHRDARWTALPFCELKKESGGRGGLSRPRKTPSHKNLITSIKVIITKLTKDPGSFQVRDDSRASAEQPRREAHVVIAETNNIEGDFKVSHPMNKKLITPSKVITTELTKDPCPFQVRDDSRASVEQPRREAHVVIAETNKIEGDFKVSHPTNKNLITPIKVIITELTKDPCSFQVRDDSRASAEQPRREADVVTARTMYEKNTKKTRLSITPTSILSNRLPSTAKQKNKMYKGAKKEAHPCVMSNVTNCVDYPYYTASLLMCRFAIFKYTYEVRKAEGALLHKSNVRKMELLTVASLDLDLVDVRSCLVRHIRATIPRRNNDMEGPPSYPPRSNPRNANVAFYCRKRSQSLPVFESDALR